MENVYNYNIKSIINYLTVDNENKKLNKYEPRDIPTIYIYIVI